MLRKCHHYTFVNTTRFTLSWLAASILVATHMTGKISQPSRGQYLVYHISHQTKLPWQAGLSPADGDWPDAGQGKVCCRSETALWPRWAGDRSCAAEKSSAATKGVGHALALCGKTRCWSCCPNGPSRSRRGDWSCTVRATSEAGTKVSRRLWVWHRGF